MSYIVQTDLSSYEETVPLFCHLDKNVCKLEQKHFIKKRKKGRAVYDFKEEENKGDVELTLSQTTTTTVCKLTNNII